MTVEVSGTVVLVAALVTALATGLGAAPFLFAPRLARSTIGVANALAAGFMIAASCLLFYEGARADPKLTVAGIVIGIVLVALASRLIAARPDVHFEMLADADARRALMLVGVMTAHSFAEGVGVGVSFGGGESLGFVTALAIAIHNIPEGLAICLLLVPAGIRVLHAAGWSILSSLPQPLVALPAFAFVAFFEGLVPLGLGFAGGAMIWMTVAQVIPDGLRVSSKRTVAGALVGSTLAMLVIEWLLLS